MVEEKVLNKKAITREEFQKLSQQTNWAEYSQRVSSKMAAVADTHERARARALEKASHQVFRTKLPPHVVTRTSCSSTD